MRQLLALAGVLVVIIGSLLYAMPQNANENFSWRLRTDLSAAFLGGSYLAAGVIEFSAARERTWANARIAVPAVLAFTLLTLFIALFNVDQYNYGAPSFIQSASTWAWLTIYAVVPPIMMVVLWLQYRHGGGEPERLRPLPARLKVVLAMAGSLLIVGGVILLVAPYAATWMWPWALRDLTARAIGAWLVGFGIAMAQIAWEGDWRRARAATAGAGVLGALQLVALIRYLDEPAWDGPQTWVYVGVLVSGVVLGVVGWRAAGSESAT